MTEAEAELWMHRALEHARQAYQADEVPIGAVIVGAGELISSGYNRCLSDCDPCAHAEIVALRAAARQLGNYRLNGLSIFVSCEPCAMCLAALVQARIRNIYFGCYEPKTGAIASAYSGLEYARRNKLNWRGGILQEQCAELMQSFFQGKRRRVKD